MSTKRQVSLAIVITIPLLGIWTSTQYAASLLAYQPELGWALNIAGLHIYAPWNWFLWHHNFYVYAPKQFTLSMLPMVAAVILVLFFAFIVKGKKVPTSHGTARWATEDEILKSGLTENDGVFLAKTGKHYLRHSGPEHVMIMAPTRSGKGVGLIIPTLFTWLHSAVITDIKGENWAITSGFRKQMGHRVIKFDPCNSDGSSARYNPLFSIRVKTANEVRDCQNVGDIIVDPQGTGNLDHWGKVGLSLLVGCFLHILYQDKWEKTLAGVASMLSNPEKDIQTTLYEMLQYEHDPTETIFEKIYAVKTKTHPKVAEAVRELLNKSENELSGVISTAMSFLGLYRDPVIARNTSQSDFALDDLMNYERPVSLYLVIPPSDLNRTIALMRMILNQLISRHTEDMRFEEGKAQKSYKWRLLLLIDEFPAFGRIDTLERALAFIAGYGIKAFLICQSINQLNKTYGQDNSIMDNCHIRVAYRPNDQKSAALLSKMLGTTTQHVESKGYSGFRFLSKLHHTISESARPLLTEGEVLNLPQDEALIFSHIMPIRCKKIIYYTDPNFKNRTCQAPACSETTTETTSSQARYQERPEESELNTENIHELSGHAADNDTIIVNALASTENEHALQIESESGGILVTETPEDTYDPTQDENLPPDYFKVAQSSEELQEAYNDRNESNTEIHTNKITQDIPEDF